MLRMSATLSNEYGMVWYGTLSHAECSRRPATSGVDTTIHINVTTR